MHTPVCQVEGLLNSVPMVDVNVHVQHPRMVLEQLQDGQHQIIDVAEPCRYRAPFSRCSEKA